ncbi:hypothetical protein ACFLZ4_01835 [Patescibacteria group bacterium]
MSEQFIRIDKIKWWINQNRRVQPLCPKHHLRLQWVSSYSGQYNYSYTKLRCEECKDVYIVPRGKDRELQYVLDKIDSKIFKQAKFINLDDEAIPIAEDKAKSKDDKFFVTARLMESKAGLRLVVYAGERGNPNKTQIFVEPEIKRLAFDQNDIHPTDVFTKLEAFFSDGTRSTLEK